MKFKSIYVYDDKEAIILDIVITNMTGFISWLQERLAKDAATGLSSSYDRALKSAKNDESDNSTFIKNTIGHQCLRSALLTNSSIYRAIMDGSIKHCRIDNMQVTTLDDNISGINISNAAPRTFINAKNGKDYKLLADYIKTYIQTTNPLRNYFTFDLLPSMGKIKVTSGVHEHVSVKLPKCSPKEFISMNFLDDIVRFFELDAECKKIVSTLYDSRDPDIFYQSINISSAFSSPTLFFTNATGIPFPYFSKLNRAAMFPYDNEAVEFILTAINGPKCSSSISDFIGDL